MNSLLESLKRTLLLMRDEFGLEIDDRLLLKALTVTRVALVADAANLASYAAQTAFITAAMLMARSGHQVFLLAPDIEMIGLQPPLRPGRLVSQLLETGKTLLPGVEFHAGSITEQVDLAI